MYGLFRLWRIVSFLEALVALRLSATFAMYSFAAACGSLWPNRLVVFCGLRAPFRAPSLLSFPSLHSHSLVSLRPASPLQPGSKAQHEVD